MRYLPIIAVIAALLCAACTKKNEFYQDYAIQNAAESDDDLNDPAQ